MVGYDKSRFFGLTKSEEEELQCGICLAIFVDPLVTQCCRQTYCSFCIKHWLSEHNTCPNDRNYLTVNCLIKPPRLVINMLNKLKVSCEFRDNGCEQFVAFGDLRSHVSNCAHNPDAICAQCGVKNGRRDAHKCLHNLLHKTHELEAILADQRRANDRSNQMIGELKDKLNFSEISLRQKSDVIKSYEMRYSLLEEDNRSKASEIRRLRGKINKFKQRIVELQTDVTQTLADDCDADTIELQEVEVSAPDTDDDATEIEVIEELREQEVVSDSNTTLQLKLENVSQMRGPVCGEIIRFKNMQWNIMATSEDKRSTDQTQLLRNLGFFLQCNIGEYCGAEANSWWCEADADLILKSRKHGSTDLVRRIAHKFCTRENDWGFHCFTSWEEITCDDSVYMSDDSITLEVQLSVGSSSADAKRANHSHYQQSCSSSSEQDFNHALKKARKY